MSRVETLLRQQWSPEQVAGYLRRPGKLSISHEMIYRHVWRDLRRGGRLHLQLRGARKRYGYYDSRGRLAGKRHISERPAVVETRRQAGQWEIETVMGNTLECVVTLVERKTGYVLVGKMRARTTAELNRAPFELMCRYPGQFRTITAPSSTTAVRSKRPRACPFTSPRPTTPGSVAPMKTPTVCYVSICRKEPAWRH